MTTPRTSKRQRLEAAGYRHVAGWLPEDEARWVAPLIDAHAAEVDRIAETSKPSGRPPKARPD